MRTWRDTITFTDPWGEPWTARGRQVAETCLDFADPYLHLGALTQPVTVSWEHEDGNWAGQSTDTWITLKDQMHTWQESGSFSQTLVHELVHVADKQLLLPEDRVALMALMHMPDNSFWFTIPIHPVWYGEDQMPYQAQAGEAYAEGVSRHLWYVAHEGLVDADLAAWCFYTYDPAVAFPAMLAALAKRALPLFSWKPGDPVAGWSRQPDGHGHTLYLGREWPVSAKPPAGSLPPAIPGTLYVRRWETVVRPTGRVSLWTARLV